MKATGIVRRIDDLGRVVIPKEIRRTLRIREGDPLEIYTDRDGEVIFKKYSPMGEMGAGISRAGGGYGAYSGHELCHLRQGCGDCGSRRCGKRIFWSGVFHPSWSS